MGDRLWLVVARLLPLRANGALVSMLSLSWALGVGCSRETPDERDSWDASRGVDAMVEPSSRTDGDVTGSQSALTPSSGGLASTQGGANAEATTAMDGADSRSREATSGSMPNGTALDSAALDSTAGFGSHETSTHVGSRSDTSTGVVDAGDPTTREGSTGPGETSRDATDAGIDWSSNTVVHGSSSAGPYEHSGTSSSDAGHTGALPPRYATYFSILRVNGQSVAQCASPHPNDADEAGWATENGEPCLEATSDLALGSPSIYAPIPASRSPVSGDTLHVAALPRPERVTLEPRSECPDLAAGLVGVDRAWLVDGVLTVPPGTKMLWNGNQDFPPDQLFERIVVSAESELVFADRDTRLRVQDFVVEGKLAVGSTTCPFVSRLEVVFDTTRDVASEQVREAIVASAGLGLVVEASGSAEIVGRRYQPTWTRLAATAGVGATVIELEEDVDWEPGQRVVVVTSSTRDYPLADENEVRTIASVAGSRALVLDSALNYRHYAGSEYRVEVGLLSHNVSFLTAEAVGARAPTFGGHIMAHHGGTLRMSGAELRGLGQQNFVGRYPFHLHHLGNVNGQSWLTDSSIWNSNWRCAVLHRTDRALISRNVAFDTFGHCFYLEDGVERGNEISFNLAARPKIMGPVDSGSIAAFDVESQDGFTLTSTPDLAIPADRAAAGFYLTNGHNQVFGNAASGGFAAYSMPNLPNDLGGGSMVPLDYPAIHFDGNTAHSAAYLWRYMGCIYAGGVIENITEQGVPKVRYKSGRSFGSLLRSGVDRFTNTQTFACEVGVTHWGGASELVNFESWDNALSASLFGTASIDSAVVVGATPHATVLPRPLNYFRRGFQFYDTWTLTALRDVAFRGFHDSPNRWSNKSGNNCALYGMTHSDQYTPQRMSAATGLHFDEVDAPLRLCVDDAGTLSSRNFNFIDTDGSVTATSTDGLPPGPRLVGAVYASLWKTSAACVEHADWGVWSCPLEPPQNVASISVLPNQGVTVAGYDLETGALTGENHYAVAASYEEAQITGPSAMGWHHAFPGGVPEAFKVWALQVPQDSFVILSVSLPQGVSCSVPDLGWQQASSLSELLTSPTPRYLTDRGTCFVRIPEASGGEFTAAGQTIPRQLWKGQATTAYFTVLTGCSAAEPACATVVSTLPQLP